MCFRLSLHYVNPFLSYCCTLFTIIPLHADGVQGVSGIFSQKPDKLFTSTQDTAIFVLVVDTFVTITALGTEVKIAMKIED